MHLFLPDSLKHFDPAMTDSGKWAYYAPNNLGVEVIYSSTSDCVASAIEGRVILDESIWMHE